MYYKKRNGEFYYIPKIVINSKIDYNDPATFLFYLKDMNYPYFSKIWRIYKNLQQYINVMHLAAYKNFEYKDSDFFNYKEYYL